MSTHFLIRSLLLLSAFSLPAFAQQAQPPRERNYPAPVDADYTIKNFTFTSGESLPELRLHYMTIGTPRRDPATNQISNAVLILHGTTGSGRQFLNPNFATELFGPGQLLDASKYFLILPDNIGHGRSSKPSDGLRARFPRYDYDDMVRAQRALLTDHLGVNRLRLILGTSMGCMHAFVWGTTFPDFAEALMPLACQPVEIAGRNRMLRKMALDSIRTDPAWADGNYTSPPPGLRTALYILLIMGSSPLQMQKNFPTRDAADKNVEDFIRQRMASTDANDFLYAFDSSRNYNPAPHLEKITARVMFVNSADDLINPPELQIAERESRRIKNATFVLLPISDSTRAHGTHTLASQWKHLLAQLLSPSP